MKQSFGRAESLEGEKCDRMNQVWVVSLYQNNEVKKKLLSAKKKLVLEENTEESQKKKKAQKRL